MSSAVKIDINGGLHDRKTGRFLCIPDRVHKMKVGGGVMFVIDPPEKLPEPTDAARKRWGEFA